MTKRITISDNVFTGEIKKVESLIEKGKKTREIESVDGTVKTDKIYTYENGHIVKLKQGKTEFVYKYMIDEQSKFWIERRIESNNNTLQVARRQISYSIKNTQIIEVFETSKIELEFE